MKRLIQLNQMYLTASIEFTLHEFELGVSNIRSRVHEFGYNINFNMNKAEITFWFVPEPGMDEIIPKPVVCKQGDTVEVLYGLLNEKFNEISDIERGRLL